MAPKAFKKIRNGFNRLFGKKCVQKSKPMFSYAGFNFTVHDEDIIVVSRCTDENKGYEMFNCPILGNYLKTYLIPVSSFKWRETSV